MANRSVHLLRRELERRYAAQLKRETRKLRQQQKRAAGADRQSEPVKQEELQP